jgi:DNA-binding XRE family transcriptional regulator
MKRKSGWTLLLDENQCWYWQRRDETSPRFATKKIAMQWVQSRDDQEIQSTDFGINLRIVRKKMGISATELARRSGLTPACISCIEIDGHDPRLSTAIKILKVIPIKFEKMIQPGLFANE